MGEYLTASELAAKLRVTPATVHAWHRRGWIPCLRASRRPVLFDLDEVEAAIRLRGDHKEADRVSE
jgi:DNA-binding transcriptional MerR regulator